MFSGLSVLLFASTCLTIASFVILNGFKIKKLKQSEKRAEKKIQKKNGAVEKTSAAEPKYAQR